MLSEQEELYPAEIGRENICQDSLVEPRGRAVNCGKFQERPGDVVDDVHNLHIPADDYTRLEQDSLVERCLGEQFHLCVDILGRKTTGPLPRMEFVIDARPVRVYGNAYVGTGVDEVFIQLVKRLLNQHACIDVDGNVRVGKLERMVADIVQNADDIIDSVKAWVFRYVVDIPGLALQLTVVRYQQVMYVALRVLDFPYWFIVVQDTLNDSVPVHFAGRLGFLGRLTTWRCVCGTCQTPQKRH